MTCLKAVHPDSPVRVLPVGGIPSIYDMGYIYATGNIRPEDHGLAAPSGLLSRYAWGSLLLAEVDRRLS